MAAKKGTKTANGVRKGKKLRPIKPLDNVRPLALTKGHEKE